MQYILLIYEEPNFLDKMSESQRNEIFAGHKALVQELQDKKKFLGGNALQAVSTATTVKVRGGEILTTDGPFAETKEVLGGYYLIDAEDLDEAIKWAAKIPNSALGSVEVRPIWEM